MEKNFQKNEIIGIASDLHKSGKTWRQIADYLATNGYTNTRGKPYSEGGIWTLFTLATDPAYRARVQKTQPVTTRLVPTDKKVLANRKKAVLDLRKSIINLDGVDADQKLGLLDKTYGL